MTISLRPLHPLFVAEIDGVGAGRPLADATAQAINDKTARRRPRDPGESPHGVSRPGRSIRTKPAPGDGARCGLDPDRVA